MGVPRTALLAALLVGAAACSKGTPSATAVRPLDPPAAPGAIAPRLTSFDGRVVLSWVEPQGDGGTLRYAVRDASGWSAARTAEQDPHLAANGADVPGVVPLAGGGLAAHWCVKRDGSTHATDLLTAVSRDGGGTWSAPTRPHRDDTATEHGLASLIPLAQAGRFGMAWLDGRAGELASYGEGGTALYWAQWDGQAFGPETVLDPRVCDCCKTAGAATASGPVVAYRDRDADERRDTSVVRQREGRWQPPDTVHADGWRLTACPTNGPAVAAQGDRTVVAWFTGAGAGPSVWAVRSTDGAGTFSPPVRLDAGTPGGRVDAALLPDGSPVVAWLEKKGDRGEVTVRRIGADGTLAAPVVVGTTSAARSSGYPRIAATGAREVLAAWTETGSPAKLRAALVTLP
ncbi:MAG TPA: sialidase family protein [Candidatus Polarisedimenticolaceae bacterium]|nr:sialidase family protein [Candidatus Polarisedimenticolaceae bacterium]